jgi:hypothetical protein
MKWLTSFVGLLFILLPFQRRFHGCIDSWSRRIPLPDFPLPGFFSTKIHLFLTDLIVVGVVLVLFFRFKASCKEFFWGGPSKYLTLLFAVGVVSLYFSITHHYALQYLRLIEFSVAFLLFNTIKTAPFIQKLAWILVTVSCLQCALGIYQYFHQHSLGLGFLGELELRHFPFHNPGKHKWIFDKIGESSELLYRACGTFTHPNVLGGFLFCAVLASFYLFMKSDSTWRRTLLMGVVVLQIFTLYIAYSRSAMLALVLSGCIWGFLQFRLPSVQFRRLAVLVMGVVVCGLVAIGLFYSQLTARGGIINYNAFTTFADTERMQYLRMAVDMIKEHPWLGIGFNNFQLYEDPIQTGYPGHIFYSKVHNIYLLIASEMGLIAGALFLLFIFSILKRAWRAENSPEKAFLLAVFCGLLFIGACDFYLMHTPHGRILFFGFAALLYSSVSKSRVT